MSCLIVRERVCVYPRSCLPSDGYEVIVVVVVVVNGDGDGDGDGGVRRFI